MAATVRVHDPYARQGRGIMDPVSYSVLGLKSVRGGPSHPRCIGNTMPRRGTYTENGIFGTLASRRSQRTQSTHFEPTPVENRTLGPRLSDRLHRGLGGARGHRGPKPRPLL